VPPEGSDHVRRRLALAGATLERRSEGGKSLWSLRLPRSGSPALEVEAPGGPEAPPPQIARILAAFVRGDELEDGTAAPDEGFVQPPEDATDSGAWFQRMLAEQYAEVLRHDPGVRLALEPEDLHRLRVAVRRTRALLRAARPVIDTSWSEPLRNELRWFGGVLGPRRDLDVLLENLRSAIAELDEPERSHAATLLDSLESERRAAQTQVAEALASDRYMQLLDALEDACRDPRLAGDVSLKDLAGREFKRLRKAMDDLGDEPSDDALHEVRILGKRARYTGELAEGEVGKKAERFVGAAKDFQDVLGAHQDAIVAEARLRELLASAAGPGAAFAAGRLVERERQRRREAREALPDAWKELERRGDRAWS
jgi:CHAD domain-containing protein